MAISGAGYYLDDFVAKKTIHFIENNAKRQSETGPVSARSGRAVDNQGLMVLCYLPAAL